MVRPSIAVPAERSGSWVKLKLDLEQELVIAGFGPYGAKVDVLFVGYYVRKHLHFSAKVRAAFVGATEMIVDLMVYV